MKFDWRLILIILIIFQIIINNDLCHHIRTSYLYSEMIRNLEIISFDSQLTSNELVFTYGIPAYLISGFFGLFIGNFSIELITTFLIIISILIIDKYFKNKNSIKLFISFFLLIVILPDSYVALFANTFFWLALLLFKQKNKYYIIPLIISCLSHPFALIASIFFIFKNKKNIIWWTPIAIAYFIISILFSSNSLLTLYSIIRILTTFFLRLLLFFVFFIKNNIIKKLGLIILIISSIVLISLIYQPSNPFHLVYENAFSDFPQINGYLRVLDYEYTPILAQLSNLEIILNQGSFFENNPIKTNFFIQWENKNEYFDYLISNNISNVLFCKLCNLKSNELDFFNNSVFVWENNYYILYEVPE